ncbi:hypothetical protein [Bradyrhizobium sp. S3.7.6]
MARSDLSTCFEHTLLPHGDKRVRGIIARCGKCQAAAPLPVNTQGNNKGNDDEIEWRFIARKLEAKGWQVGKRHQDHRCPRCQSVAKLTVAEMKPRPGNMQLVKEALMNNTTVTPPKPTPAVPRTMTRDDKNIIYEKLKEVYVSDKVGYGDGWSDQRVATDLGVPRGWVATIRDEFFGEEITSEVTRKMIAEARELITKVRQLYGEVGVKYVELGALADRASKIEKHLAEIAKVMK